MRGKHEMARKSFLALVKSREMGQRANVKTRESYLMNV